MDERDIESFWRSRDKALEGFFGPMDPLVVSAERGWSRGGPPTVNVYHGDPDRVVYCTSEISNILLDQPEQETFELLLVTRPDSSLAQGEISPAVSQLGCIAQAMREGPVGPGHMVGPLSDAFRPFSRVLFLDYDDHPRLYIGGRSCHVVLCFGITERERVFAASHSLEEVQVRLREARLLPFTDLDRPEFC
jgi:hypothetical protein